jgi:hypothetical protein
MKEMKEMKNKTTEFSFVLQKSKYGVGVFSAHDIQAEAYLRLFGDEDNPSGVSERTKDEVPENFRHLCVDWGDVLYCPTDFSCMEVGWFLNHSKTPNAYHRDFKYYAKSDIKAGEEIVIDYNTLEEPEEVKEDYY